MHDVIVVGGGHAGLSAALYLARGRHDVLVLDTGTPRNRFSPASHGLLAQDGAAPLDVLETARAQVARYPTVSFRDAEATDARVVDGGFALRLFSGEIVEARRLVLATGIRDVLPEISGLEERWGLSVLHCPYCHGYEFAGRRLGALYSAPESVMHAQLIANWGPTTLFLNGNEALDAPSVEELTRHGVALKLGRISSLEGAGTALEHVLLADGSRPALDALYVAPRLEMRGSIAQRLGCATRDTPFGVILAVDEMLMTSVPGVFAAGDVVRFPSLAVSAASDGALAGISASRSLIFQPTAPSRSRLRPAR